MTARTHADCTRSGWPNRAAIPASGSTPSWIATCTVRRSGVAEAELRADRDSVLARADVLRAGWHSRIGRLWAGQQLDHAFGALLRDVLASAVPDPAEVFALTEAARSRMLLDSLAGHWVEPSGARAPELAAAERDIMAYGADSQSEDLVWDEMRLGSELALGRSGAELDALERRYRDEGVGFDGVAQVPGIEHIQACLGDGELLIEYVIAGANDQLDPITDGLPPEHRRPGSSDLSVGEVLGVAVRGE